MSLEFDATYRDGAILPDAPLDLPNNTPIRVLLVPKRPAEPSATLPAPSDESFTIRPKTPRFTPDEFDAIL
jgi:hypothetical protein